MRQASIRLADGVLPACGSQLLCYRAILTIAMASIVILGVHDSFKLSEIGERASFPSERLAYCLVSEGGYYSPSLCW